MMIMSQRSTNDVETVTESVSGEHHRNQRRLCDFCGEATAVLYCRADSAKLCLACDRQVHSTNQLFTKHTRWLLCDSCDSTPATIFCCTHAAVFCQNCDWDAHQAHKNNSKSGLHDRRPLEGFSGCPSASELLGILGFDPDVSGKKGAAPVGKVYDSNNNIEKYDGENAYGFSDFLVWETPSVVSLDDLIMPPQRDGDDDCSGGGGAGHAFQAMGVPPLPKNRNATCGQHKEEILFQIREISKLEPNFNGEPADFEPFCGFQFLEAGQQPYQPNKQAENLDNVEQPTFDYFDQANSVEWFGDDVGNQDFPAMWFGSHVEMNNAVVPDKVPEAGDSSGNMNDSHEDFVSGIGSDTGIGTGRSQVLPRFSVRELNSQERESAISRYKEKKKTRRYEKHIRYETRKARAESRTRIRGRFAKIER